MDSFIEVLKAILQGIVQGITEWLPISSTGHIILLNEFLPFSLSSDPGRNQAFFDVFKVLVQLGSILAVLVLFFRKLNPFTRKKSPLERRNTFSLWGKVLVASIPAGIVGILLNDFIDEKLSLPAVIAVALIVYGILFIWMESRHKEPRIHNFKELDYKTVLLIGVFQMLALIPGTSRSGSTILGAVLLGTSRYVAAEFSFFMAIPVMVGASGVKLLGFLKDGMSFTGLEWTVLITGMAVAFLVSLLVIRFFMNFIKKHDFKPFGYYRIVLGMVIIILLCTGVLQNSSVG